MTDQNFQAQINLIKLYAAIDLKNLEFAYLNGGIPGGLSEFRKVQQAYVDFFNAEFSNEGLSGLKKLVKKAAKTFISGQKAVSKTFAKTGIPIVSDIAKLSQKSIERVEKTLFKSVDNGDNAVTKVIDIVKDLSNINPGRALSDLNGSSSRAYLYVLIPSSSIYLSRNPAVYSKKMQADRVVSEMIQEGIHESYLKSHIRNQIMSTYKRTPNQMIIDISQGKGNTVSNESFEPSSNDWLAPLANNVNITGEPLQTNGQVNSLADVQEYGTESVPKSKEERDIAGKVTTWVGLAAGGLTLYNGLNN